ncbi:MAG TPA: TauD/TfdA family dioxygenase, partial [Rhodospirillales bacterium]|nr:TauD/TfdA family dioxygenase [Rhodospirillales bacterium]
MAELNKSILPPRQVGFATWRGSDLQKHPNIWTTILSPVHVSELEKALVKVVSEGVKMGDINKENFPLPSLGPVLMDLQHELLNGRGFALIRGLKIGDLTEREIGILFFGLGSYFGNARSQNAAGQILGHVQDLGGNGLDNNVRIYQTSERQTF